MSDGGLYARCKRKVSAIQAAYDGLLAAVDDYVAALTEEAEAESAAPAPDPNKLLALDMQRNGANRLRATLENQALDDLIRFSDRVIRIKHWEDGVFL